MKILASQYEGVGNHPMEYLTFGLIVVTLVILLAGIF